MPTKTVNYVTLKMHVFRIGSVFIDDVVTFIP